MVSPAIRTVLVFALASAAIAGLAGCAPGDPSTQATPSASPSLTATAEPTLTPTASVPASPSPTPTPTPTVDAGEPVDLTCDELITPQRMYDFNNNFSRGEEYTPAPGSRAAEAVAYQGLACEWVNESSGDAIHVAAADLAPLTLETLRDRAASEGTATSRFGGDGYFSASGSVGEAEAFTDDYWIIADSEFFAEAADAEDLMKGAIAALP